LAAYGGKLPHKLQFIFSPAVNAHPRRIELVRSRSLLFLVPLTGTICIFA
jgi:hypothetical protein